MMAIIIFQELGSGVLLLLERHAERQVKLAKEKCIIFEGIFGAEEINLCLIPGSVESSSIKFIFTAYLLNFLHYKRKLQSSNYVLI